MLALAAVSMCAVAIWTSEDRRRSLSPYCASSIVDGEGFQSAGACEFFAKVRRKLRMFGAINGMLLDMLAAVARKDHMDRRLGWRKVNPHGS